MSDGSFLNDLANFSALRLWRQMSANFAVERLEQERRRWRQDHPSGFIARPQKLPNGEMNLFTWDCLIPGRPDTAWANGFFPLRLDFPQTYPSAPPVAKFAPPVPHVNVFPSGTVCLSILHDNEGWKPSMNLRQILVGVQELLTNPNPESPAHEQHFHNFMTNKPVYEANIRKHAAYFTNPTLP
jgi:ubiquitin-conjugating enzyme E2 I